MRQYVSREHCGVPWTGVIPVPTPLLPTHPTPVHVAGVCGGLRGAGRLLVVTMTIEEEAGSDFNACLLVVKLNGEDFVPPP